MKNKKIVMALALIGLTTATSANALMAHVNPAQMAQIVAGLGAIHGDFALYFNPVTGLHTQAVVKASSQTTNAVNGVQSTQQIQIAQQEKSLEVEDYRSRTTKGLAEIAKKDNEERPTLQQCVEASKSVYRVSGGGSSASSGGWSNGTGKGKTTGGASLNIPDIQKSAISAAAVLAEPLKTMKTADTCSATFGNVAGCGNADGNYAEGDIKPQSLKYNISKADREGDKSSNASNWTLDSKGEAVSVAYIQNSVYSQQPKTLKPEEYTKNPVYAGLYRGIVTKLNTAAETLLDIKDFRVGKDLTSFAKDKWAKNKTAYKIMFPNQKFPDVKPSLYEVINFEVNNDYLVPVPETNKLTGDELMTDIGRKISLGNYIAWKQLNATENTNILLANLLVQNVTPVDIKTVNAEFNKVRPLTP